jgi:hypothetical protein
VEVSGGTPLSRAELAATAGVGEGEIDRLVEAGVLVERATPEGPFRGVDVFRIRVASACEQGGLPMQAMAAAIKDGRLSFAYLETWPFEATTPRGAQTQPSWRRRSVCPSRPCARLSRRSGSPRRSRTT